MAGTHERLIHRCKIVAIRIKTGANAIDVAKRGKEPERLGKKASAVEEIEKSLCAGSDEAIAYRRRDDPLESPAQALLYFSNQVLPAWKPIFARQHQLGITL